MIVLAETQVVLGGAIFIGIGAFAVGLIIGYLWGKRP